MPPKRKEILEKSRLPLPARRALTLTPSVSRFAAPQVARFIAVKAVGSFVPTLTRKAFEKFGFSTATLLTDWEKIVGAEVAGYTIPERLKWPRAPQGDYGDDEDNRAAATLVLRVDPARALDVEYRARQIVDRINAYFGYRAVETVRIVQAPVKQERSAIGIPVFGNKPGPQNQASPSPSPDEDEPLRAALARLERGILREKEAPRRP